MRWLRWAFVVFLFLGSARAAEQTSCFREVVHPTPPGARWFVPAAEKPRSVTVVFHGLNLLPARMDPLAKFLEGEGHEVLRGALAGHRGDLKEFQEVRLKTWIEDTETVLRLGAERAADLGVPFHVVGFSLGALMAELVLSKHP